MGFPVHRPDRTGGAGRREGRGAPCAGGRQPLRRAGGARPPHPAPRASPAAPEARHALLAWQGCWGCCAVRVACWPHFCTGSALSNSRSLLWVVGVYVVCQYSGTSNQKEGSGGCGQQVAKMPPTWQLRRAGAPVLQIASHSVLPLAAQVAPDDNRLAIKAAWRAKSLLTHPDKVGPHNVGANEAVSAVMSVRPHAYMHCII